MDLVNYHTFLHGTYLVVLCLGSPLPGSYVGNLVQTYPEHGAHDTSPESIADNQSKSPSRESNRTEYHQFA